MKATGSLTLLILPILIIQSQASIFNWDDERLFKNNELDDWLTDAQKAELEPLKSKPTELRDKILEFYKELPKDQRVQWDKFYRKYCVVWLKEVASDDELNELKEMESKKDKQALFSKIDSYRSRLTDNYRNNVDLWKETCDELLTEHLSRKRREIDKNFHEFIEWMTEEQKQSINEIKAAGSSFDKIREKGNEFFASLPTHRQVSLKEDYKEKCKRYFEKISEPDEAKKMKSLYESGNDSEIRSMVKNIIARKTGDDKELAMKMEKLCIDVVDVKVRMNTIDDKINTRLSWMTDEQKQEVKKMYADGKPQADIRAKIFEFLSAIEGPAGLAAKEQTRKECYKWMEEVASTEEIAALHKMHETDHDACKKKVREFIGRLPADKREEVEKNLPFCEKVWYGEHAHHSTHGHHHRRHLAARRRRHLHAIDRFLNWLTPEQKSKLEEVENSGAHFDNVIELVKKYYGMLPEEKKAELKANFKSQCFTWVKEVTTLDELDSIIKMHESKDHMQLKKKLAEFESRLTEEQKHTIEHVRDVCLGLWEVQNTRKRRDDDNLHEHSLEEAMDNYLTWMTSEDKERVKALYDSSDREAFYNEILKIMELSNDEVRMTAVKELKAACKHYGKDVLGEENVNSIEELRQNGATPEDISKKVNEMIEEISDQQRKIKATRLSNFCKKICIGDESQQGHHRHHHHSLEGTFHKYLTWLDESQKNELKTLKESGHGEDIYKKILQYYESATGDVKEKAVEELQSACKHYIKDYVGKEKAAEFRAMKDRGAPVEEIAKNVHEAIKELPDEGVKSRAKEASALCERVFGVAKRSRRDHNHKDSLEEAMDKYLSWLNDDQKIVVKSIYDVGDRGELYDKVMEYYENADDDIKQRATNDLKDACRHYVKDLIGEENGKLLREMKENGASNDAIATKVEEMIEEITDEGKKAEAVKASTSCKKIYGVARRLKRDHHHEHNLEETMEKYLTWLSKEQKDEVKTIYEGGDREATYKKVLEYYEAATGDTKEKAATELKTACKHFIKDAIGDENAAKIKELKESGATNDEIAKKVDEFIAAITDAEKKEKALRASTACKKIYGVAKRLRRDHHHEHNLEEAMEKYLTWLSKEQKDEVKTIYEGGDREATYKKVLEYYEAATGDTKEKAATELKSACKHFIKDAIGDENAAKIKELKESGATNDEIAKKVDEFIAAITDAEKKEKALRASTACKKIYGVAKRRRRDHHHEHNLEEAMEKYLTWLSKEQKDEVKTIYEGGDREATYKKVLEYYEAATGDTKEKAATELKSACKHFIKDAIGDENAAKIKELKESGATNDEIAKKVDEFIAAITDAEKKEKALRASTACMKIYGVAKRRRRDHHHEHNLEEAMEKYLTWLSKEQKDEVKTIYEGGDREATYKKVLEYYEAATGDTKEKAATELKSACKHFIKDAIGDENAAKIKELKESGATNDEIAKKVDEFIAAITDAEKKEKALRASTACKKIYGVAKRRRRDHHHEHNLEEAMEKYLTWLSKEQKDEVKTIYEGGDREATYKKVLEYFEAATGETKEKAATELKSACKHFIKDAIGDENAAKIKELKESGATNDEIAKKVDEFIAAITDAEKKEKALRASTACKKIYGVAKRLRRDHHHHHEHNVEEAMQTYLRWLSDEQKTQVKKIYGTGDRIATYNKVMELLESASGDDKEKSTTRLKAACKHYIKDFIGSENVAVIKTMKENGATNEEISSKIDEFIAGLTDDKRKAQAERAALVCKKIYGVKNRKRRNQQEIKLEEALTKYLTWLSEEQKTELKQLKEKNEKDAMYTKIMEYFESTSGDVKEKAREELKNACKHYMKVYVGDKKAEELKALKDSGISMEEMLKRVNEAIETIDDEAVKAKAQKLSTRCEKVFVVTKVRRHLAAKHRRYHPDDYLISD